MKSKLLLLLVSCCTLALTAKSQIYADTVISSSNTSNPQNAVSSNDSDYATMSTTLSINTPSTLRVGFSPFGFAGMTCVFKVQSVNGGLVSANVLQNLDVILYDKVGNVVTEEDSFTTADINLLDGSTDIYSLSVRIKNNAARVASAELRLNSSLIVMNELRIYAASIRFNCQGLMANAVTSFSNVSNPNNAVDADATNYATMQPPLLGGFANITTSFPAGDNATDAIRFILGQGGSTITGSLIGNLKLTAYDAGGNVIAAKNNYTLADVHLDADNKFSLSVPLPKGSLVASGSARLQGIVSLLTDLRLYSVAINKTQLNRQPAITPDGGSICAGDSIRLFAKPAYAGQTITWQWYKNNSVIVGANKEAYYASSKGNYFVTVTNQDNCKNLSYNVTVTDGNCFALQSTEAAKISAYPNPFTAYTTLSLTNVKTSGIITVSDKSGNIVQTINIKGTEQVKLLVNARPGAYFIKLVTKQGDVFSTKVIKF